MVGQPRYDGISQRFLTRRTNSARLSSSQESRVLLVLQDIHALELVGEPGNVQQAGRAQETGAKAVVVFLQAEFDQARFPNGSMPRQSEAGSATKPTFARACSRTNSGKS